MASTGRRDAAESALGEQAIVSATVPLQIFTDDRSSQERSAMHVLMLGWEFPPFIAGGLGTACHGLTKAMARRGLEVTFVLPKAIDRSESTHVNLLSPAGLAPAARRTAPNGGAAAPIDTSTIAIGTAGPTPRPSTSAQTSPAQTPSTQPIEGVRFIPIEAGFVSPYQRSVDDGPVGRWVIRRGERTLLAEGESSEAGDVDAPDDPAYPRRRSVRDHASFLPPPPPTGAGYDGDLIQQVERFAHFCVTAARGLKFDVIHAHDWMTYPAGLFIARMSGKPLVVHVHSTEFDRSGAHVNQRIYDIERRGMHGAMRVVAVSQLTKNVVMRRYSVPDAKVTVVYNGVDIEPTQGEHVTGIQSKDRIVLYFGRITYQKGPEYFIYAAKRVLQYLPDIKFVVAGSGDQAARMIELAAQLGIGHKVLFTGFLRGRDIKRVFSLADLYVMPSVSEPFGIAPLEAMAHQVPALISKSSGVSEVLTHALKVDFWDIDDMANKIIAVLRHPPLRRTLQEHGAFEVRKITWDGAAQRCEKVYREVAAEMTGRAAAHA